MTKAACSYVHCCMASTPSANPTVFRPKKCQVSVSGLVYAFMIVGIDTAISAKIEKVIAIFGLSVMYHKNILNTPIPAKT